MKKVGYQARNEGAYLSVSDRNSKRRFPLLSLKAKPNLRDKSGKDKATL